MYGWKLSKVKKFVVGTVKKFIGCIGWICNVYNCITFIDYILGGWT